ncbi:conserved phage C-terminal domain-containing protein [Enterococcus alishanensis]
MADRKIPNSNRGFKGVWIPAYIWLDSKLSIQEMVFLVEIESLDVSDKGCFASNKHFSDFFGLTSGRCSQIISSLQEKGYIDISFVYGRNKEIEKRVIRVLSKLNTPIKYSKGGYLENAKGSNTLFSNTNNNKDHMSSKLNSIPFSEIIAYLNQLTGKKYKNTQKWRDLIKARWNEGQRLDDFKKVIDVKTSQWLDNPKMSNYLRPQTLFGNKFDEYLNESRSSKEQSQSVSNNSVVF